MSMGSRNPSCCCYSRSWSFVLAKSHILVSAPFFDIDQEHREGGEDSEDDENYSEAAPGPSSRAAELQQRDPRPPRRWFNPFQVLHRGFSMAYITVRLTTSAVTILAAHLLPSNLFRNLQGGVARVQAGPEQPEVSAGRFLQHFEERYGQAGPQWQSRGWAESSRVAHDAFKLLYVYLHAPQHQDTDRFCRETLCNPEFADYLNNTFIAWAGDITRPDAYKLSQSLRATSYPFTALLAFSGSRIRLIAAAEGFFPAQQLLNLLRQAQEAQSASLIAEQTEQIEQDRNRQLREEQDDEFYRSLAADQERERQRQEADRKKAEAAQRAQEAAAQERAKKEEEEKRAADRVSILRQRRATKASQLGEEPSPGSANSIRIRVKLPDGRNFDRKFLASDPLQRAYDFVDSLDSLDLLKYNLATHHPLRVFTEETLERSFEDLGLTPQAVLFVQSQDD